MNEQIITEVLNDILEELKQSNQSLKTLQTTIGDLRNTMGDLQTTIGDLQERTSRFEQKLTDQQVIAPDVISAIAEAQPKNVIRQWRLSFFPDNDINGSFKHLVNKITLGMICLALIAAGYKLGLHYLDRPVSASQAAAPQTSTARTAAPQTFGSATPGPVDTLHKKHIRKRTDSLYELR